MFRFLAIFLLCSSCFVSVKKTPITRPEIDREYYLNSIEALEEALSDQPGYTPFIELQLSYYEQLGWPKSAEGAIERANQFLSSDQDFFAQKIAYYRSNRLYGELIKSLERYPTENELPLALQKDLTEALIQTGDTTQAKAMLERLVSKGDSTLVPFVFSGFKSIKDTAGMVDTFIKNESLFSVQEISDDILPLYVGKSQWSELIKLIKNKPQLLNQEYGKLAMAKGLVSLDSLRQAEQLLIGDTTWLGNLMLMDLYIDQYKFVSASRIADQLIGTYPDSIMPFKKRAWLSDRRGYFELAIHYYEKALEIDSTDEEALSEIGLINKKIAYLRQQKEQNQIIPMFGIDSLKKDISQ
jgi:tetratricopeptide (TPR) repeat protein